MSATTDIDGLFEAIRTGIESPEVAGLVLESELEPLAGPGAVVQPPTYASSERNGAPAYAVYDAFVPEAGVDGWFREPRRGSDSQPEHAPAVVLDAVASQANRAEEALWAARHLVGGLPGIVVRGDTVTDEQITAALGKTPGAAALVPAVRRLLAEAEISSWTASHRHVDAWIRYAQEDGSATSAWTADGPLRELITNANSTRDATSLYEYAIGSILYGYWLASGVVERHRQARIYSSEIIGYDARPAAAGAGRYEPLPVSNRIEVAETADGFSTEVKKSPKVKPSNFGFGMVPGSPQQRGFVCGCILRRATISFSGLRAIRFGADGEEKTHAAGVVLTSLALLGHHLSSLETNLRSGCELVTVETRAGLRRVGTRAPQAVAVPWDTASLVALVQRAVEHAEQAGLRFAEPIVTSMSDAEVRLIALSAAQDVASVDEDA